MVTLKWIVRWFFWLFLTMREISPTSDIGPRYAMKVCLALAFGSTFIIMGVITTWAWELDVRQSIISIGAWISLYLLVGIIFFFSEPMGNFNPVWQTNGPW